VHRARTAQPRATSIFGSSELKSVAEYPEKRCFRSDADFALAPVHSQREVCHCEFRWSPAKLNMVAETGGKGKLSARRGRRVGGARLLVIPPSRSSQDHRKSAPWQAPLAYAVRLCLCWLGSPPPGDNSLSRPLSTVARGRTFSSPGIFARRRRTVVLFDRARDPTSVNPTMPLTRVRGRH